MDIVLYILSAFIFFLFVLFLRSYFAKRMIKKGIGNVEFKHLKNIEGNSSFTGVRVSLPETPPGNIEVYICNDIMVVFSKHKMLWLFDVYSFPLFLIRPNYQVNRAHSRLVYISKFNIIGTRINMDFFYGGAKVNYSLYLRKVNPKEDIDYFMRWFGE